MSTKAKSNSAKKAVKKEAKHSYIAVGYDSYYSNWVTSDTVYDSPESAGNSLDINVTNVFVIDLGVLGKPSETKKSYPIVKVTA